ncbi:hypothetical protein ACJJTC_011324 [Scirpophaga incertulas]
MPITRSQAKRTQMAQSSISDPGACRLAITNEGDLEDRDSEFTSGRVSSVVSTATVQAKKIAAEAEFRRRQLERARLQADRDRQREQELAALEAQAEEDELRAKLAAIEASSRGSHGSHRSRSSRSSRRLETWVKDVTHRSQVNDFISFHDEQPMRSQVMQPTATQAQCNIVHTSTSKCKPNMCGRDDVYEDNAGQLSQSVAPTAPQATSSNIKQICTQEVCVSPTNAISTPVLTDMIKAITDSASATRALVCQGQLKKPRQIELPKFSGEPSHWLQFKRALAYTYNSRPQIGLVFGYGLSGQLQELTKPRLCLKIF